MSAPDQSQVGRAGRAGMMADQVKTSIPFNKTLAYIAAAVSLVFVVLTIYSLYIVSSLITKMKESTSLQIETAAAELYGEIAYLVSFLMLATISLSYLGLMLFGHGYGSGMMSYLPLVLGLVSLVVTAIISLVNWFGGPRGFVKAPDAGEFWENGTNAGDINGLAIDWINNTWYVFALVTIVTAVGAIYGAYGAYSYANPKTKTA